MQFDPLRNEDIAYAQALLVAGVAVELHVFSGTFHGSAMAAHAGITQREKTESFAVLGKVLGVDNETCRKHSQGRGRPWRLNSLPLKQGPGRRGARATDANATSVTRWYHRCRRGHLRLLRLAAPTAILIRPLVRMIRTRGRRVQHRCGR
ncbi:alpha/beta hydrolase fold domain-containing protein [Amycolatopsis sp.]|uniref:alpha/beta hydrolase fold domain-containing protein n=1 Tax=Amycolatopsis sp. TaxID=37632 RepID=UPI00262C04C6|nr:alpha/beta hydrolase fold domain-containing protein [Amycolatopsis sp.]